MSRNAGLAGQASFSGRGGDPRARRNAQAALATNVQYGPEFEVDQYQRLRLRLGRGLKLSDERVLVEDQIIETSQAQVDAPLSQTPSGGDLSPSAVVTVTANYSVAPTDAVILADATSAAFSVTLPSITAAGAVFHVKKIDTSANAVTVKGPQTIDGSATLILATAYDAVHLVSDNTEWWIL
jgi:hypothetical protein